MNTKRPTAIRIKRIAPSVEVRARVAAAAERVGLSREQGLAIASAEPQHATALAGSLRRSDSLKLASKRLTRAKKVGR